MGGGMSKTETFEDIFQRASQRKGGNKQLEALLGKPATPRKLKSLGDDRYLSAFSKKIFQSGFVWRVVENKWPAFEKAFFKFDVDKILMMPDDMLERKAQDPSIIRNFTKVKSIRENAFMIQEIRRQGDSFAAFIANWPSEDIIGLWDYLKKHGSRLGGNTGPYALRTLGKDTFILSRDVERYLKTREVFSGAASSKRSRTQIQAFFNAMQQESGRPLQQISQVIGFASGDNVVFPE